MSDAGSGQWQQWIRKLEDVDQQLLKARTAAEQSRLNAERADVIEKLIEALPADQRETWIRQFADTVSSTSTAHRPTRLLSLNVRIFAAINRIYDLLGLAVTLGHKKAL